MVKDHKLIITRVGSASCTFFLEGVVHRYKLPDHENDQVSRRFAPLPHAPSSAVSWPAIAARGMPRAMRPISKQYLAKNRRRLEEHNEQAVTEGVWRDDVNKESKECHVAASAVRGGRAPLVESVVHHRFFFLLSDDPRAVPRCFGGV
jgi:hypothetical protein